MPALRETTEVTGRDLMTKERAEQQHLEEVAVSRDEIVNAREGAGSKRKQKTWYLSEDVIERANAAVYWAVPYALRVEGAEDLDVSRIPDSASALVESGLWAEVLRLEKMLNGGEPFPPAPANLRPGPGRAGVQRLSQPRKKVTAEPSAAESAAGEGDGGSEDPAPRRSAEPGPGAENF